MKVKIIDESQLTRPYISKKAMYHIVAKKDKYIKERDVRIASLLREEEQWVHIAEEEKLMINALKAELNKKQKMIYIVGLVTYLVGTITGYVCG